MKEITTLALFVLAPFVLRSQEALPDLVASSGGNFISDEFNLHWSVGEVAVAFKNDNNTLSEGLHQVNLFLTDVSNLSDQISISTYPNPTTGYLNIENESQLDLNLQIYSVDGTLVHTIGTGENTATIDIRHLPTGSYHLICIHESKTIYTSTLIKL